MILLIMIVRERKRKEMVRIEQRGYFEIVSRRIFLYILQVKKVQRRTEVRAYVHPAVENRRE